MLRSVHLFVSLFINRITQSLVKDLNEKYLPESVGLGQLKSN